MGNNQHIKVAMKQCNVQNRYKKIGKEVKTKSFNFLLQSRKSDNHKGSNRK